MLEVVSHGVIGMDWRIVLAGCHVTDRQGLQKTNKKSNGQLDGPGQKARRTGGEERRDGRPRVGQKRRGEVCKGGIENMCCGLTAGLPPSASSRQPHTTKTRDRPKMV